MTSNAYISDVAKKSHKNAKNIKDNKVRIFFPKFEGKIYDPTLNKALNILKLNEVQLQKEIQKRKNNINLLKGEVSLNNINNNHELEKEKKKAEDKIKILEKENSISIEKLEELKNRRNIIQYKLDKELGILDIHKKIQLTKFNEDLNNKEKKELGILDIHKKIQLTKFNEDLNNKEKMGLFEDKMKKLHDESKKLHLKMQTDLEKAIDKRNTQMDKIEKEKEEKILKFRKDMKEKERGEIKKRNLKAKEEILKLKEIQNKI